MQTPSPKSTTNKIVVGTTFDDRGQPWQVTAPTLFTSAPGSTFSTVDPTQLHSVTFTGYDALDRPSQTTLEDKKVPYKDAAGNVHSSATAYYGDHSTTVPAAGSPTATYTDANNRTTQVSQTNGTGAVVTNYSWDWAGHLKSMTRDATGTPATSTFGYDMAGDQISAALPDSGTSTTTYDNDGNPIQVTDANNHQLWTTYDYDDRRTALHDSTKERHCAGVVELLDHGPQRRVAVPADERRGLRDRDQLHHH